MPITKITVNIERLVALKKYENVTYSVGAEATVPPGIEPTQVYLDTLNFCKEKLQDELNRVTNTLY